MKKVVGVLVCCICAAIALVMLVRDYSRRSGNPMAKAHSVISQREASPKPESHYPSFGPGRAETTPAESVARVIPSNKMHAVEVERRIAAYIAKGERDVWLRIFNDLLDLAVPRDEAVRIAKGYLNHPEPIIRYVAAETLYRIGDRSGAQALIEIVLAPERIAIPGVETDLRAWAASTLAAYRENRAADAVATLYFATEDLGIRSYAASLGSRQVIPDILADMKKRVWKNQLEQLAQLGVVEAKPIITQQFENESAPVQMRVAAAGAMLRFGEREPYISFLLKVARDYVDQDSVGVDNRLGFAGQAALRAIALVSDEEVRKLLEHALDSKNPNVAQTALVQLRVNYPESAKARERLVQGLSGTRRLDAAMLFRLAAMSEDHEIRTLAAQRNALLWQKAALHEREWDKDVWLRNVGAK